jgi:hypothetical protein
MVTTTTNPALTNSTASGMTPTILAFRYHFLKFFSKLPAQDAQFLSQFNYIS